jgi:S-adenosylmethionine hydrolase
MPIITLTSDFGEQDGYVGILKGVILRIAPHVKIVDITHHIPACDIKSGAWVLNNAYRYFPHGTVHLAVVDPGVGSDRRPLILANQDHSFVGPDNGLFSDVLATPQEWKAFIPDKPQYWLPKVSNTFHGRDIFAPLAAHLSLGNRPADFGPEVGLETLVRFRQPAVARIANRIAGLVVHVDVYGNLITNIDSAEMDRSTACLVGGHEVPFGKSYASVEPGHTVAYAGSHGCVEIGTNQGRADQSLGAKRGAHVALVLAE